MMHIDAAFFDIGYIERLSNQQTAIHRLDARAKLLTTLIFISIVVSFSRYDISGLLPFFLYPLMIMIAGNLPMGYLLKRVGIALPFAFFIGIFNPLFDREIVMRVGTLAISGGWLSFLSMLLRVTLTVLAALLLIATTGFTAICAALEQIGVPRIFVIQLLFLYRYLFVLLDEASRMTRAQAMRSFDGRGLGIKVYSSMIGHLLLRTFDRARRIHLAMLSRGFDGEIRLMRRGQIGGYDLAYLLGWSILFVVMRLYNVSILLGNLLTHQA